MDSQNDEAPFCPDEHGMNIPMNFEFGYVPNKDGIIHAIVEWIWDEQISDLSVRIDSMDTAATEFLVEATDRPDLGEWIDWSQYVEGTLRPFRDFATIANGRFRIDDNREGHNLTYSAWSGSDASDGFAMKPKTLYHHYNPNETSQGQAMRSYVEMLNLMYEPGALFVDSLKRPDVSQLIDDEFKQALNLQDRVVVWDVSTIERSLGGIY